MLDLRHEPNGANMTEQQRSQPPQQSKPTEQEDQPTEQEQEKKSTNRSENYDQEEYDRKLKELVEEREVHNQRRRTRSDNDYS
jgi:hypothetical protein